MDKSSSQSLSAFSFLARRELIANLVDRNLKIRYKSSVLGFFWSLLTPLSFIAIYAVFAHLLKFGGRGYLPYLISGIIIWQFTISCMNDSLYSIAGNSNLVKKVYFPRIILPLSTAFADTINFLLTFLVLIVYLAFSHNGSISHLYLLLPAIAMQLALCIGLACLCGTSNVFFRDTEHIVGVFSQAWFFMSPIMYPFQFQLDIVSAHNLPLWLPFLNPMTGILALYRNALLATPNMPLSIASVSVSAFICLAVLLAGLSTLRAGDRRFGDVL